MKDRPSLLQGGDFHPRYELRFRSLFDRGRALSFPCDAEGHVDIERLSAQARANLAHARANVGREFETPEVVRRYG